MNNINLTKKQFADNGFVVINHVMTTSALKALAQRCELEVTTALGTRNLLNFEWVKELAQALKKNASVKALLPHDAVAVQCTYFSKDSQTNWSVALHRDLSIPVKKQLHVNGWSAWSKKEGLLYVQPPRSVLSTLLAVRLHLEDNDENNGALELVPGSHRHNQPPVQRVVGAVKQGGILAMNPLTLHASTKLKSGKRRVLHFLFGPKELPDGMAWAVSI